MYLLKGGGFSSCLFFQASQLAQLLQFAKISNNY